jgi:hypothetical protein
MNIEPSQKRHKDLKASILDTLELIKEYEDEFRLSDDPIKKRHCKLQIAKQRELLESYQAELKRLEETIIEMPQDSQSTSPIKVSLAKLPSTNPELFGREKELKMLNDAWTNPNINIVTLVSRQ